MNYGEGKMDTHSILAATARDWLARDPLFLDTETTGLGHMDQVVQVAVVDKAGNVLLDVLVKPTVPIGAEASRVHGITDAMVARSPTMAEVWPALACILRGRLVLIYNRQFDVTKILASLDVAGVEFENLGAEAIHCAMELYAEFWGDIHPYYGTPRWQSLGAAAAQCGIEVDGRLHGARVDADVCRQIVMHMANYQDRAEGDTMAQTSEGETNAQDAEGTARRING